MSDTLPALMPMFTVRDPKATIAWFEKLGFETTFTLDMPDGGIAHAEVKRGAELVFMLGPSQTCEVGSAGLSLYVNLDEDVDAYHDFVRANGIAIAEPLTDQFWGDRTFRVDHSDGYRITFAKHVRDVSMEEMSQSMAAMAPA